MIIVFDMDNTLTDEMGAGLRPGILDFLKKLKEEKYELKLWTNSQKKRAQSILIEHKLNSYFSEFIFREDYDPQDIGIRKDISKINGDFLIDDDPKEIQFIESIGKKGFLISSYRRNSKINEKELEEILKSIKSKTGLLNKLFK